MFDEHFTSRNSVRFNNSNNNREIIVFYCQKFRMHMTSKCNKIIFIRYINFQILIIFINAQLIINLIAKFAYLFDINLQTTDLECDSLFFFHEFLALMYNYAHSFFIIKLAYQIISYLLMFNSKIARLRSLLTSMICSVY